MAGSILKGGNIFDDERKKRSQEMLSQLTGQPAATMPLPLPMRTSTAETNARPLAETREAMRTATPMNPYTPAREFNEFLPSVVMTLADVVAHTAIGFAEGIEGIADTGATLAAWGARVFGADEAEEDIREWIERDLFNTEKDYAQYFQDRGSFLGDGLGGRLVRGAASGVGQMLPSVAVAMIPGVGSAGALATLGASAFGGGVEEALSEEAGLGAATLYGVGNAAVELATEKLTGGMGKVFGGGWLDDVTGSVLKTGAGRVVKEAAGEGVEEGIAELANPALKSIYKGVDAFSEYGDKDYWKGVGESALIGAGTSVAFGGTVGRALGTSGKAADVSSLAEDIKRNTAERMELYREGKITEGDENDRRTSRTMLADYRKLEEILQKADAAERSRLIKANNLGGVVDESGTVRPEVLASLTIEDADGQTAAGNQNAAEGKKTPITGAYLSPGLWRQSGKVQRDLEGISADLKASGKEGKPVELFRGELSEAARENYNAFKRAAAKLSVMSGDKLQFALIDAPSGVSGVHRGGTVYLNTATLEDGKWASVLFEEATHFTDGTAEAVEFKEFLIKEDGLFEDVADGLLKEGNAYGFTDENVTGDKSEAFNREMYAHMASRVLTSPEYVDKLVRADRTLAEKIKNRISDVAETLRSVTSKDIEVRKQLRQATKAQGLFEKALEGADGKGTEVDFLFVGKNAKTADKMRLATAEKMLEGGVDSETIRKETGWHQGYDGKWRFEIDDSKMKYHSSGDAEFARNHPEYAEHEELTMKFITGDITKDELERLQEISGTWGREKRRLANDVRSGYVKLQNMIDHDILFEAYPQLQDVRFTVEEMPDDTTGSYSESQNLIRINSKLSSERARKTLIHEIQHVIQSIEGFAAGAYVDETQIKEDLKNRLVVIKAEQRKVAKELDAIYAEIGFEKYSDELMEKVWNQELELEEAEKLERAYIAERSRKGAMLYDYKKQLEAMAEEAVKEERAPFEKYQKTAGEIEARDAAYRADLSEEERKNTRPDIDREDVVFAENSELSKEFLGWTADGVESYKTGKAVSGMPFAEKEKKFKNDFLQQFKGRTAKFERNGHTYYARFVENKKGLGEFIHESSSTRGQSDETGYRAKIRLLADGDIFKIVEDGEYKNSRAEKGKRTAAHKNSKYWDYFWKEIFVDGAGYDVVVNVRNDSKTGNLSDKTRFVYSISFVSNGKRATPVTVPPSKKSVSVNLAIALDNSIPQNSEKSTPKSDFSLENVSEEAGRSANVENQQASGDFSKLWEAAGITEPSADLIRSLDAFREMAAREGVGEQEVERTARTLAMSMAGEGTPRSGEGRKAFENRMYRALTEGVKLKEEKTDTSARESDGGTERRVAAQVTYDNVNDMIREIRERYLEFEVNGKTVIGAISRKDGFALSKEIYEYLRANEQTPAEETSVEVARMILNAAKVDVWRTFNNEDGTTTRERVTEPLSKRIGAEQKKQIVTGVSNVISGLLGKYEAQKEARSQIKEVKAEARERINKKEEFIQELRSRVRKERREMLDRNRAMQGMAREIARVISLKGDKYANASDVKNEAFTGAMKEIAKMNWRGGVVNGEAVRKHFSALVSWYTPENALYGVGGKANERYRYDIAFAMAEIASGEGEMTAEEIRAASEVIRYFAKEIEDYGTIYKDGKRVEAQPVIKKYIGKIEKANEIASRSSNITKLFRSKFARLYGDPAMLMRLADSYVEGGFFTEQFEQLRKGTIRAAVLERELLEDFEKFWSGKDAKEYGKRYNETEVDFMGNKIPLAEAISLYMTLGRDHALSGAAYAGFEIEGKDGTVNVSDGFAKIVETYRTETLDKLSPEEQLTLTKDENALIEEQALRDAADYVRAEIAKNFTAQDRRLIEITERIMERCRDYKVDVDEILYGESNVTGGYYYPVKRAGLAESVDTTSMFEGDRVSNLSINKETVKNAHKLLIEPAHVVLLRHVKAISLYDGLGVFTDNFNRLYNLNISENKNNPTTIRTSLGRSSQFAKDMLSYFKEMKQDVEGISKRRTAERWYNDAVGVIRSGYATYQLGANPKTWLTQVSSLVASTNILDADTLAKGLSVKDKADVDKYCRLAWLRNNEGAAVLAQSVTTGMNPVQKAGRDALQKVRDISMLPIGKMDRLVVRTLWGACQVQVEKDGGAAVGTEKNKKAAGELLERVILETQQNSLATERSAAMRSSDELLKATTMFRSDAMKIGARWIDAMGKMYAISAQIRIASERLKSGDTSAEAELERLRSEKKTAAQACARASASIVSTALFSALLTLGWKWLMDRDDEESVFTFVFDVIGNLIGGVPVFSDVYSFFVDGFEMENFLFDTVNNVLGAVADCADMLTDAVSGKEVTKQDAMKNLKKLAYALGQISGLPTRNVYNFITGIVSRFSPEAGLWIEMQFSSRSVAGDLEKALLDDDDQMVDTIVGVMLDQDGGEMLEGVRRATAKLIKAGEQGILPRSIPDKLIGEDDVEIELTKKQRQQFEKVYSAAYKAANDLVRMGYFKRATKEEQAYALKFIWSTYYDLAKDVVLGQNSTKKRVLFAEAIPVERLALIAAQAANIKADLNKDGKPISGSRMHKIEALLESLDLRAAQKYMMMGYLGYTNKNGRDIVERHIRTLDLSKTEQEELLEMSGYKKE